MGTIGGTGIKKIYAGNSKIKVGYIGAQKVYSSGNIVTYYVDTGVKYVEEVDCDATCLLPRGFVPAKDGYTFVGWRENDTASESVLTEKVMGDEPVALYAVFKKAIKLTHHKGSVSTPTGSTVKYQIYNNSNIKYPEFEFTSVELNGYTFRGWTTEAKANAAVVYEGGKNYTLKEDVVVYATWQKTVTVTYNGNGSAEGATGTQSGTVYLLCGGAAVGATFVLQENGFSKTDYTFAKWALNSAAGTQYAPGASFTTTSSVVMYAVWLANPFYWIKDGVVQDGFPSTYANYSVSYNHYVFSNKLTEANVGGSNNGNTQFTGETVSVETKGNKYIEIVMNAYNVSGVNANSGRLDSFLVGGVECKDKVSANAVIKVEVSNLNEVTLKLVMTAWASGNMMHNSIKSIRFYS